MYILLALLDQVVKKSKYCKLTAEDWGPQKQVPWLSRVLLTWSLIPEDFQRRLISHNFFLGCAMLVNSSQLAV